MARDCAVLARMRVDVHIKPESNIERKCTSRNLRPPNDAGRMVPSHAGEHQDNARRFCQIITVFIVQPDI